MSRQLDIGPKVGVEGSSGTSGLTPNSIILLFVQILCYILFK